jgi:hypothetical protein
MDGMARRQSVFRHVVLETDFAPLIVSHSDFRPTPTEQPARDD